MLGLSGETLLTERPGHATELAEQAARDGADLIVSVGGDGTFNETVNGVMRAGTGTEVAVIPIGTGMDFVRTHGIPTRFDDAVRVAVSGSVRTIDLGRVSFLTWAGESAERLKEEAADLLYHLLVLLEAREVAVADVLAVLERRMGTSGLKEKAERGKR